jgi:hypothetical protein
MGLVSELSRFLAGGGRMSGDTWLKWTDGHAPTVRALEIKRLRPLVDGRTDAFTVGVHCPPSPRAHWNF